MTDLQCCCDDVGCCDVVAVDLSPLLHNLRPLTEGCFCYPSQLKSDQTEIIKNI